MIDEIDEPDGVRPQETHPAGRFTERFLPADAVAAYLSIAAADGDGRTGPDACEVAKILFRMGRAHQHNGDIRGLRQGIDAGEAGQLTNGFIARIDWPDMARKTVQLQEPQGTSGCFAGITGSADDRDALRTKQTL
jgi:hypothetical protein